LNAAARLRRSDNVTFQNVAKEAILIRMDTGTYFSLNKVGTEFWERLDGLTTIEQHAAALAGKNNRIVQSAVDGLNRLAESMAAEHGGEAQVVSDDVRAFARSLTDKYFIDMHTVVKDLLELAEKMAADRLVDAA